MAQLLGIRIRHRTLRSCIVAIPLLWVKLPKAPWYGPRVAKGVGAGCPTCGVPHPVKTYHLNVDGDGGCVVSRMVFDNLCKAGAVDGVPADQLAHSNGGRTAPRMDRPFEYVGPVEAVPLTLTMGPRPAQSLTDAEGRVLAGPGMAPPVVHLDQDEKRMTPRTQRNPRHGQ